MLGIRRSKGHHAAFFGTLAAVLLAIIVTGVCFAVSQFMVSNFDGPYLPDIIAAIVTIIGLEVFLIFWKPPTVWRFSGVAPRKR